MTIERIRQSLVQMTAHRFSFLYGPGIDDAFITPSRKEMDIEAAIYRFLKQAGFDTVLYFSPHRAIYGPDRPKVLPSNASEPLPEQNPDNQSSGMHVLGSGPFGSRNLGGRNAHNQVSRARGMGDIHALRILDALMQAESGPRTAVVFSQAETSIQFFEDHRLLAGILGEWSRLPANNPNICVFLFSIDTLDKLKEVVEKLPLPEVRENIFRDHPGRSRSFSLVEIPTPDVHEVRNLIAYAHQLYRFGVDKSDLQQIMAWMEAEKVRARDWLVRLSEIQRLDVETTRVNHWFSANRGDGRTIEERLDALVGLTAVKERVYEMAAWLMLNQRKRTNRNLDSEAPLLHLVFTGNPGTGKTTVARLIGEIYHDIGILKRGHIVEAKASDLVAEYVGGTAVKTNKLVDQAIDGVLFIDEAYRLTEADRGGFGREAVDTLLTRMEDERSRLVVIVAGYPEKMDNFLSSNPGLPRRFPKENRFEFEDYATGELWQILAQMLADRAIPYEQETGDALHEIISGLYASRDETFGNAGEMRNLVDALDRRRAARIVQNNLPDNDPLQIQDVPPGYQGYLQPLISQEEILQEIDAITGLEPFKLHLKELIVNQQEETEGSRNHLIFKGLAGTGKSYAVQFLGACLKKLGWLQKGHVVEVTRSDLIAGYVGQTAGKTREVIRSALDGILVINHAVDLMAQGSGDFQRDALTALYRGMEDYGHRLLVVLTGAPAEIDRLTAGSPGIRDHFLQVIEFATPSIEELVAFLNTAAQQDRYAFSPEALEKIKAYLHGAAVSERNQFGNYRAAIALFAKIRTQFHKRIRAGGGENSPETQREILPEDIPEPYYPVVVSAADALAQPPTGEKKIINHDWVLPVGSHSPIEKRSNDQEKNGES